MIEDIIRSFFWGILSALLWLTDKGYEMMRSIALIDVSDIPEVWTWWNGLIAFVSFFIFIRVIALYIKAMTNEEFKEKFNGVFLFFKTFIISATIAFFPIAIKYTTSVSVHSIAQMSNRLGYNPTTFKPSSFIINTGIASQSGTNAAKLNYNLDLNINEKQNGKYKFFPGYDKLFILFVIGIVASFGFLIAAVQIASRMFTLIMKILVSPIPISGLINPEDQSFKMYVRMCLSDVITNYVQILMIYVILSISGNAIVAKLGALTQLVVLVGGITVLTKGMHELAQLIGGDVSGGSVLQQIAAIRQSTHGVGRGISSLVGGGVGGAVTAGAMGVYGAGRMMGKESLLGGATSAMAQSGAVFGNHSQSDSGFQGGASAQEANTANRSIRENLFTQRANDRGDLTSARNSISPDLTSNSNLESSNSPEIPSKINGFGGRFVHSFGNHMYEASANRLRTNPTIMRARSFKESYKSTRKGGN